MQDVIFFYAFYIKAKARLLLPSASIIYKSVFALFPYNPISFSIPKTTQTQ